MIPTKDTLTALKSDVTFESACLELIDNSLDSWKRTSNRSEQATISVDIREGEDSTELLIQDNTGGVPREQASMFFGLGRTAKSNGDGTIGTFGVGAKKSLVNLGVPFTIKSRSRNEDTGWQYRIDRDWFEKEEDWSVPIYDSDSIPPGSTEIHIEDLNYNWSKETGKELRERLGQAYNHFLSDEMQELYGREYDLTIIVDGEPVEGEGLPPWSYTPFDGLHPRRYENIHLQPPGLNDPVKLHITVGILSQKDTTAAGTDIYVQKRKVETALRDDTGGYGTGTDRLGVFNPRHDRLKLIIELETKADGQELPWDTQKSSIDKHNPIMRGTSESRGVYNWLRRTAQAYFDADADKVPSAFIQPYTQDHEKAVNGGEPERIDFTNRERIIPSYRPNSDIPQVKQLRNRVEAHAVLGIRSTSDIPAAQVPAYQLQFETEYDGSVESLPSVNSDIPQSAIEEPYSVLGKINELARVHLEHGVASPGELEEWQRPAYMSYFKSQGNLSSLDQMDSPEGLPTTPNEIELMEGAAEARTNGGPEIYSEQTVEEDTDESAEIFLVFGGETEDERGSKVLDISRKELTRELGLSSDVGDDVVWEHLRHHLRTELSDE